MEMTARVYKTWVAIATKNMKKFVRVGTGMSQDPMRHREYDRGAYGGDADSQTLERHVSGFEFAMQVRQIPVHIRATTFV